MSEEEAKEKTPLYAYKKSDTIKNWAIGFLILYSIASTYWIIAKSKSFVIMATGDQIFWFAAIIIAAITYYFYTTKEPELPNKFEMAEMVAREYHQKGNGLLDQHRCEVQRIGEKRAHIYFPDLEKTFTFEAGKGVIEERWSDMEERLIGMERSAIISSYTKSKSAEEIAEKYLKEKGFTNE